MLYIFLMYRKKWLKIKSTKIIQKIFLVKRLPSRWDKLDIDLFGYQVGRTHKTTCIVKFEHIKFLLLDPIRFVI